MAMSNEAARARIIFTLTRYAIDSRHPLRAWAIQWLQKIDAATYEEREQVWADFSNNTREMARPIEELAEKWHKMARDLGASIVEEFSKGLRAHG